MGAEGTEIKLIDRAQAMRLQIKHAAAFLNRHLIWGFFLIGMGWIVIGPMGWDLARLPGDLGDTRFNIYVLEHFFRWITGQDADFWTAPFFYPYPLTTAFSDHHFGTGLFYAAFRWLGQPRDTALQLWYALGFALNYAAAAFVLSRLRFKPLASAAGAFFFAFGLPMLGQQGHVQLIYRFGVPLACYFLWDFSQVPRLRTLALLALVVVWQFFISLYTGYFLALLLLALAVLFPFREPKRLLAFWPARIKQAWCGAAIRERILSLIVIAALLAGLAALFVPYFSVAELYGFKRSWAEAEQMLPRPRSFFIADNSQLWRFLGQGYGVLMRGEHQLFPGAAVILLALAGVIWRFDTQQRRMAFMHLFALLILIGLVVSLRGFSLYRFLWELPGVNSVRAVTRILLVLMWPMALFAAYALDGLLSRARARLWAGTLPACALVGLLVVETAAFDHYMFSKAEAQQRLERLRSQIPAAVPADPILILAAPQNELPWISELDAMLLSQELGWPTLNGYSGFAPRHYQTAVDCTQLPKRILHALDFIHSSYPQIRGNMQLSADALISRTVPLGFNDCDPAWWQQAPAITVASGPLPPELFSALQPELLSLGQADDHRLRVEVTLHNRSAYNLPAVAANGIPIRLSTRLMDLQTGEYQVDYHTVKALDFDIPSGASDTLVFAAETPPMPGRYRVEVCAYQPESEFVPHMESASVIASQMLVVNDDGTWELVWYDK